MYLTIAMHVPGEDSVHVQMVWVEKVKICGYFSSLIIYQTSLKNLLKDYKVTCTCAYIGSFKLLILYFREGER